MTIRTPQQPGSRPPAAARPAEPGAPPAEQVQRPEELAEALEAWFLGAARDLPWRRHRTAYRALVSEMMLQQTQVQRVVLAFAAFVENFPTPERLAQAQEQDVLAAWQGLGYYRRARLLHAAAKAIVANHGGQVPSGAKELRELPGIGRYTAGAISSIVFGAREPIVDGNVHRVLSRLAAHSGAANDRESAAWAWRQAEQVVQAAPNPGATNEALMELGATVCTPAAPRCTACPLAARCAAHAIGAPERFPAAKASVARRTVHWHALVVAGPAGVLLEQRGERGMWARMWQVPTIESGSAVPDSELQAAWGVPLCAAGEFTHTTTHRAVVFRVRVPAVAGWAECAPTPTQRWVAPCDLAQFPLANAMWRVLETAGVPVSPPPSAAPTRRASRAARSAATGS